MGSPALLRHWFLSALTIVSKYLAKAKPNHQLLYIICYMFHGNLNTIQAYLCQWIEHWTIMLELMPNHSHYLSFQLLYCYYIYIYIYTLSLSLYSFSTNKYECLLWKELTNHVVEHDNFRFTSDSLACWLCMMICSKLICILINHNS